MEAKHDLENRIKHIDEQIALLADLKAQCLQKLQSVQPAPSPEMTSSPQGMTPDDNLQVLHDMFVQILWEGRKLAVPLAQLKGVLVGEDTKEAIEDWHYWVVMGHQI